MPARDKGTPIVESTLLYLFGIKKNFEKWNGRRLKQIVAASDRSGLMTFFERRRPFNQLGLGQQGGWGPIS